ncbi:MAG: glycine cleavage system aminomethyltransferase GcvT [Anaerolineae bacterium]
MPEYWDAFLGSNLNVVDPDIQRLITLEEERQARRIILIPSESIAPASVRAALGSVYNSVYAEGYPALRMTRDDEALLLDIDHQLSYYRRYGDRRFYKGAENVNILESLAQRRCADCFANDLVTSTHLYANVQPLSGAAANLAVYDALMSPGDVLMGMDLYQGGHLTHGSQFNISGKRYKVASYGVSADGQLDYDEIERRALEAKPKVIVAGFTSYPWAPDWQRFRQIADACGAYLMADIAHPAGLVIAGAYPSPIGYADVVTFTTHKTLCGPRGAVIVSRDEAIAGRINSAVFPGAQGGPHTNKFAAMAVAFHIAQTDAFKRLMFRITENAQALAGALRRRGLTLAYGGTDTHLMLVDLRSIKTPNGEPLRGEAAVRIMELAGLVANKNTIPGDTVTALGSGVRLGTPWVTQRGMGAAEMDAIAEAISRLLVSIKPFHYQGLRSELPRGKIDHAILEAVRDDVLALTAKAPVDVVPAAPVAAHSDEIAPPGKRLFMVSGRRSRSFLSEVCSATIAGRAGDWQRSLLLDKDGKVIDDVCVITLSEDWRGRERFVVVVNAAQADGVTSWLRDLSDGYVEFDADLLRKIEGPVVVRELSRTICDAGTLDSIAAFAAQAGSLPAPIAPGSDALDVYRAGNESLITLTKPYFIGHATLAGALPTSGPAEFAWQEPEEQPLRRTPLYEEHRKLTRHIIPFAGWEMPVWYSSVGEEHDAVRHAAGLFDVAHMGVFEVSGPNATAVLDIVSSNYAGWLQPGQSQYGYLLDPDGNVIDDIMVYYVERGRYVVIVNASNADKDWAWLNAVNEGRVLIDRDNPAARVACPATLRDLKDPAAGADRLVDIALQGPAALPTLQALTDDAKVQDTLARLRRTDLATVTLAGMRLVVARTGYTGEDIAYEIFVHPDEAVALWQRILEKGATLGVKPCGLGARDSTRIEAGLPLYGHELDGPFGVLPQEAGFPSYLKAHKAFYVGRSAVMGRMSTAKRRLVRFKVNESGARALRGGEHGEAIVNRRGNYIGRVTSATLVGGTQVGLALVDRRYTEVGTPLAIYPAATGKVGEPKAPADLAEGDSVMLPMWATVVPRFPPRRGSSGGDQAAD